MAIIALFLMVQLALTMVFVSYAHRWISGISKGFGDFFMEVDKDGLSQFGRFVSGISEDMAVRMGQNVRAGINGSIGGMMKGATAELEEAGVAANPELGLMQMLPKSVRKNNLAMMGLQWFLQNKFGGKGSVPAKNKNNGSGEQVRFNL